MDEWSLPGFTELEALGEGGFGRVVLARHESGTVAAVKYLFARHLTDRVHLDAFRGEAAALRRVTSPHVARLYDFVETAEGAAIVMEAVRGVPLREILTAEPVLEPESALAVLKGSLLGLADAHAAGVVHRDYKPDNVLVGPDRESKLVDFGIAVLAGESGPAAGTPAYMAPEQWRGGPATRATDVYAATCVFFQAVAGHRPYLADDTETLRGLHEHAPIPAEQAPEPVRGLIERGMAKDPAGRPAGAREFVAELESVAAAAYGADWERRGRTRLAQRAGVLLALSPLAVLGTATALAPGAAVAGAQAGGVAATVGAGGITAGKVAAAVAAVVATATVGTVIVFTGGDDPPPPPVPPPVVAQAAVKVDLRTRTEHFTNPEFDLSAQYPHVSGLTDPAVEKRVNDALMAPIDDWVRFVRNGVEAAGGREPDGGTAKPTVKADVRMSGPKLVSVVYTRDAGSGNFGNHAGYSLRAATVDLTTGRALTAADVFRDLTTTPGTIGERLLARYPEGYCAGSNLGDDIERLAPEHFTGEEPVVQPAFAADNAEFVVYTPRLGYAMACDFQTFSLPYQQLADLLRPELRALLPQGTNGPPGKRVELAKIVLTVPESWPVLRSANVEEYLGTGLCTGEPESCPGVLFADTTLVAHEEGRPYRGSGPRRCHPVGRPDLEQSAPVLLKRELRPVGTKKAAYSEWRVSCGSGAPPVIQRLWYLPKTGLAIVDEWNTPGLDRILETAGGK